MTSYSVGCRATSVSGDGFSASSPWIALDRLAYQTILNNALEDMMMTSSASPLDHDVTTSLLGERHITQSLSTSLDTSRRQVLITSATDDVGPFNTGRTSDVIATPSRDPVSVTSCTLDINKTTASPSVVTSSSNRPGLTSVSNSVLPPSAVISPGSREIRKENKEQSSEILQLKPEDVKCERTCSSSLRVSGGLGGGESELLKLLNSSLDIAPGFSRSSENRNDCSSVPIVRRSIVDRKQSRVVAEKIEGLSQMKRRFVDINKIEPVDFSNKGSRLERLSSLDSNTEMNLRKCRTLNEVSVGSESRQADASSRANTQCTKSHDVTFHHTKSQDVTFVHTKSHDVTFHHTKSHDVKFAHTKSHDVTHVRNIHNSASDIVKRDIYNYPYPDNMIKHDLNHTPGDNYSTGKETEMYRNNNTIKHEILYCPKEKQDVSRTKSSQFILDTPHGVTRPTANESSFSVPANSSDHMEIDSASNKRLRSDVSNPCTKKRRSDNSNENVIYETIDRHANNRRCNKLKDQPLSSIRSLSPCSIDTKAVSAVANETKSQVPEGDKIRQITIRTPSTPSGSRRLRNRAERPTLKVRNDITSDISEKSLTDTDFKMFDSIRIPEDIGGYIAPSVKSENNVIPRYFVERKKLNSSPVTPCHRPPCTPFFERISSQPNRKLIKREQDNDRSPYRKSPTSQSVCTHKNMTSSYCEVASSTVTLMPPRSEDAQVNTSDATHRLNSVTASVSFNNPSRHISTISSSSSSSACSNTSSSSNSSSNSYDCSRASANSTVAAQNDLFSTLSCRSKSPLNRHNHYHHRPGQLAVKHIDRQHPLANGEAINSERKRQSVLVTSSGWASFDRRTLTDIVDRLSVCCGAAAGEQSGVRSAEEQSGKKSPVDRSSGCEERSTLEEQKVVINNSSPTTNTTDGLKKEQDCESNLVVAESFLKDEPDCDSNEPQTNCFNKNADRNYRRNLHGCLLPDGGTDEKQNIELGPMTESTIREKKKTNGCLNFNNKQKSHSKKIKMTSKLFAVTSSSDQLSPTRTTKSGNTLHESTQYYEEMGRSRLIKVNQCPSGQTEKQMYKLKDNERQVDAVNTNLGYWVPVDKSIVEEVVESIVSADVFYNWDMMPSRQRTTDAVSTRQCSTPEPKYKTNTEQFSVIQLNECSSTDNTFSDYETKRDCDHSETIVESVVDSASSSGKRRDDPELHKTSSMCLATEKHKNFKQAVSKISRNCVCPSRLTRDEACSSDDIVCECEERSNREDPPSGTDEIPVITRVSIEDKTNDCVRRVVNDELLMIDGEVNLFHAPEHPYDVLHTPETSYDGGFKWKKNILRRLRLDQVLALEPWMNRACGRASDVMTAREWECLRSRD